MYKPNELLKEFLTTDDNCEPGFLITFITFCCLHWSIESEIISFLPNPQESLWLSHSIIQQWITLPESNNTKSDITLPIYAKIKTVNM